MFPKHHRRIIERAFKHSQINANYVFPINKDNDFELSDRCSLHSRDSQTYDLYCQNLSNNTMNHGERKIIPINKLLKPRNKL